MPGSSCWIRWVQDRSWSKSTESAFHADIGIRSSLPSSTTAASLSAFANPFAGDDSQFSKMSVRGVDGLSPLPGEKVATPERHLTGLARDRLNGQEALSWTRHRLTNRFGVDHFGLATLHIELEPEAGQMDQVRRPNLGFCQTLL